MTLVRIEDERAVYEFDAEIIAGGPDSPVSTALGARSYWQRPRWMEATLYRKPDRTYVLHQVNYSLVWHLVSGEGHVRKPGRVPWSQLERDAVYCGSLPGRGREQCPKAGRRGPRSAGQVVLAELPQHKVSSHPDTRAVITAVMTARRPDGSVSVALSGPMRELLDQAEANDPAFRGGAKPVMRM